MALLLCLTSREKWRNTKIIHPAKDMKVFFFRGDGIIEIIEVEICCELGGFDRACVCLFKCVCLCVCGSVTSQCLFQPPFVHHSLDDVVSIAFFLEKKAIRTYTKGHVVMLLLLTPQLEVAPPLQTMTNQLAICGNTTIHHSTRP